MKQATFLKKLDAWRGDARLYRLSEAIAFRHLDGTDANTDHVVVSAITRHEPTSAEEGLVRMFTSIFCGYDNTPGGEETFIFPSDAAGNCYNMVDLEGSFQGGSDHALALRGAGYEITQ